MDVELISRAAAIDAIDGIKPMQGNLEQLVMKALCWASVKSIPAVDAAPVVHARWKAILNPFWDAECSECGYKKKNGWEWRYCPRCGAKMDKED